MKCCALHWGLTAILPFASALNEEINDYTRNIPYEEYTSKSKVWEQVELIMARRAYDFACYVAWQVGEANASAMDCGLKTPQEIVNEMDDMPMLPEESKE